MSLLHVQRGSVPAILLGLVATVSLSLLGCGSTRTTHTSRTANEQLVLTSSWDLALQRVDFRPLAGVPTYLDVTNVAGTDKGWQVSSLRQAMIQQGVLLRDKKEDALWVVEASVGAYGTDNYDWMIGVPEMPIPPEFAGYSVPPVPELPVIKKQDQHATTKLALFAYQRDTGQFIWSSGTILASANSQDVYVFGMGPFQSGTIREGAELMGVQIPLTGESTSDSNTKLSSPPSELPYLQPPRVLPPTRSDLETLIPIPEAPKIDPYSQPATEAEADSS